MITFKQFLSELHVPKSIFTNLETILVHSNGWRKIGESIYTSLWDVKNYMVKVYDNQSEYQAFVHYCLKNRKNPHLPTVIGFLKPITANRFKTKDEVEVSFMKFKKLQILSDKTYRTIKPLLDNPEGHAALYASLWDTIMDMKTKLPKSSLFDLCYENMLQTEDGTPVIVDPWGISDFWIVKRK